MTHLWINKNNNRLERCSLKCRLKLEACLTKEKCELDMIKKGILCLFSKDWTKTDLKIMLFFFMPIKTITLSVAAMQSTANACKIHFFQYYSWQFIFCVVNCVDVVYYELVSLLASRFCTTTFRPILSFSVFRCVWQRQL